MSTEVEMGDRKGGEKSDTQLYRVVHAQDPIKNANFKYPFNRVTNTKYTWWNFIPKNLLEQFSLAMNKYFLLIAILQLFSVLTPVNPLSTWGPLIVIFGISAVKEAVDDHQRAVEDDIANKREVWIVRNGDKIQLPSRDIQVGDIVYIKEDEQLPCDLVLLKSSFNDGSCFIQTTNLDGETNLKQRVSAIETRALTENEILNFKGVVKCAVPDKHIYKFDSRLWLFPSKTNDAPVDNAVSLSATQLLQQTTSLRNTEWIYGLAVYTGNQTKFGMNKGIPPLKLTKIDLFINRLAVFIFCFQILLVIIFGVIGELKRKSEGKELAYLNYSTKESWYEPVVIPLRFLLLNSTMIPISLKVTLDLCKLYYAKFIQWDETMFDGESGEGAVANNTSISEDLGQIEYVLTDKTGTLTQNAMVFKQCSIQGVLYNENQCLAGGDLSRAVNEGKQAEVDLLRNFVLNNSVVPVKKEGKLSYKASSPDEASLVEASRGQGVVLQARENALLTITVNGQEERYKVMQELEFSSERKRMSVVVLDLQTNRLKMYMKGADEALLDRLNGEQNPKPTLAHLDKFADQGLRTLMFCARDVSEEEFKEWQEVYQKANSALEDRLAKREQAYELLEKELVIQGGSAIEDKLQENVSETIETLRAARIKFWMLTGDKYSTALQIATACSLKSPDDRSILCSIEGKDPEEVGACIRLFLKDLKRQGTTKGRTGSSSSSSIAGGSVGERKQAPTSPSTSTTNGAMLATRGVDTFPEHYDTFTEDEEQFLQDVAVIIRGTTLELALAYHKKDFTRFCLMANTVICCRVAPAQKAELVRLVKNQNKMTLAIGDGGNDVAMIQEANIGVGIRGKEGLQAARASDYAVANFRSLKTLLLIHGHYSYMRTALVAQYSFYKSFAFCCVQIAFGFFSFFSGASLFNSICITAYNAVLFFPIVTFILDKDIPTDVAFKWPILYRFGVKSTPFNLRTFAWWMLRGIYHAIVVFTICIWARGEWYHLNGRGFSSDLDSMSIVAFCGYLWIQSTTMLCELHNLTLFNMVFIWLFHVLTFLVLFLTNVLNNSFFSSLNPYYAVTMAFFDIHFWLTNLLMLFAAIVPVLLFQTIQFNYRPKLADQFRYAHIRDIKISTLPQSPSSRSLLIGQDGNSNLVRLGGR